jgi:hypothetical protein
MKLRDAIKQNINTARAYWWDMGGHDQPGDVEPIPPPVPATDADVEAAIVPLRQLAVRIRSWLDGNPESLSTESRARWSLHAEMLDDRYSDLDSEAYTLPPMPDLFTGMDELRERSARGEFEYSPEPVPKAETRGVRVDLSTGRTVAFGECPQWIEEALAARRDERAQKSGESY